MKWTAIGQLGGQRVGTITHERSFQCQEATAGEVTDQAMHVIFDHMTPHVGILPGEGVHNACKGVVSVTACKDFARGSIQQKTPFRPEEEKRVSLAVVAETGFRGQRGTARIVHREFGFRFRSVGTHRLHTGNPGYARVSPSCALTL